MTVTMKRKTTISKAFIDINITTIKLLIASLIFVQQVPGCHSLVRLASWNLLAQEYARPSKYPWCDPEHLEWDHRKELIIPKIREMDADIICLQEMQVDYWPNFIEELQPHYSGVIQEVSSGHNVASAVLIRENSPVEIDRAESRSRALITVLRKKTPSTGESDKLYMCNVHLEAGKEPENNLNRYFQLKSLFRRLKHHCRLDKISLDDAPVILAGDFNMLRSNPLHTFLLDGELIHLDQMNSKPPIRTIPLKDAYLETTDEEVGEATFQPRPCKVLNPLDDANHEEYKTRNDGDVNDEEDRQPLRMTYAKGYVLDYVWSSNQIKIEETLLFNPRASDNEPQRWPEEVYPSDHLPIGVDFTWK